MPTRIGIQYRIVLRVGVAVEGSGAGVGALPGVAGQEASLVGGVVAGAEVLQAGGVGPFACEAVSGGVEAGGMVLFGFPFA